MEPVAHRGPLHLRSPEMHKQKLASGASIHMRDVYGTRYGPWFAEGPVRRATGRLSGPRF